MRPAGIAAIEQAKANGEWERAYEPPSTSKVPDYLERALRHNKKARAAFDALNSQNRYAILHRVAAAKKPETRERRVAHFVEMLAKGEKLYP